MKFLKPFKFYTYLLIIFCLVACCGFCSFASASGDAVYQTIINYLVSNQGSSYSWYLDNRHICVFDATQLDTLDFYINDYYNARNERNEKSHNGRYIEYIACFCNAKPYLMYENSLQSINGLSYDQVLYTNNASFYCFIYNTGEVYYTSGYYRNFYFQSGINLIYNDDDILVYGYDGQLVDAIPSSIYNLNPTQVAITGTETQSEMYQKVMSWFNANANFYANVWANGDNPSCLIFDNRNRDVIANLYSNNSSPNYDFIVCLSPTRFCAYEQNNNSFHFNFLTYQNKQFWYLFVDIGNSNNFTFYRYNINNQTDFAVVTQNINNRIFLCSKDIFLKYNSNNFILNNNGEHELFYSSIMENSPVYPVNPDGSSAGSGSIWSSEDILFIKESLDDVEENSTSILSTLRSLTNSFVNTFLNAFLSFTTDILNVFNTVSGYISNLVSSAFSYASDLFTNSVSSLISYATSSVGMGYIIDSITFIKDLKDDAILYKNTILHDNGFFLNFTLFNTNFSFNPLNYFFINIYPFFYRIINLCFLFYMIFYFYGKLYKLIRQMGWGGDNSITINNEQHQYHYHKH